MADKIKERSAVRKALTELSKSVGALLDEAKNMSVDILNREIDAACLKLQRLRSQLTMLDRCCMDLLGSDATERDYEKELLSREKYADATDLVEVNLRSLRERYIPQAQASAARDSGSLLEAVHALVELQSKQMARLEEANAERVGPGANLEGILGRLATIQESNCTGVRLPETKLTRFGGDQTEFVVFFDQFRTFVHEHKGFDNLRKHQILRDLLFGVAATALQDVPVTADTYEHALKYLIQKFGCVRSIVFSIFSKMLEIPKVNKIDDAELRSLCDKINNYTITLNMLKLDSSYYICAMYTVLLKALPDSLALRFLTLCEEQFKQDDDQPLNMVLNAEQNLAEIFLKQFQKLKEFLDNELAAREKQRLLGLRDDRHKQRSGGTPPAAAAAAARKPTQPNIGAFQTSSSSKGGDSHGSNSQRKPTPAEAPRIKGCLFCGGDHSSRACKAELTLRERQDRVREAGACRVCLKRGHWADRCGEKVVCAHCKGKHSALLCKRERTHAHVAIYNVNLLPTGHCRIGVGLDAPKATARFLLDSGSQQSFITARLAKAIGAVAIRHQRINISVFGGRLLSEAKKLPVVQVRLHTRRGLSLAVTALVVPTITADAIPTPGKRLRDALNRFALAEVNNGPVEIDILLSAFDAARVVLGAPSQHEENVFVVDTEFGHVVTSGPPYGAASTFSGAVAAPCLDRFWDLESMGVLPSELSPSNDSQQIVGRFLKNITRLPDGRYMIKINFNDKVSLLDNNRAVAMKQFHALAKRLSRDNQLKTDYLREIRLLFKEGFAEKMPEGHQPRYLMPHFPILQPEKTTYKVRPVFNASAAVKGNLSLNDCIYDTPNMLPCPLKALCNFRMYRYGWTGDIQKAYLMIRVHPDQRDFLSFFWFKDEDALTGQIACRMTSISFGVKDSQFNTIMVIQEHAKLYRNSMPVACHKLINDMYMDDLLTGMHTVNDVISLWNDVNYILAEAKMQIRKFRSNCPELRSLFKDSTTSADILTKPRGLEKVLGVVWDELADVLTFNAEPMVRFVDEAQPTMRTLMGACARLYDPQGLLAPFVTNLKLILQDAHLAKLALDAELPPNLKKRWLSWCSGLQSIESFKVPRWLGHHPDADSRTELHAFSDASDRAYAAAVYLKTVTAGKTVAIHLVAAKTRLAPIKQLESLTIPRKELLAAVLATRLAARLSEYLQIEQANLYFWSDAQVVLHWIHSNCPQKWGIFVQNRLTEILKQTNPAQWRHCPGSQNPADLPSRGSTMQALNKSSLWTNGPEFLTDPESNYASFREDTVLSDTLPEVRILIVTDQKPLIEVTKFSSVAKLIRVVAYVLRAAKRFTALKLGTPSCPGGPLTAAELIRAKQHLLRQAQSRCLGEIKESLSNGDSVKDSKLTQFKPFIDDDGLVRVGGRLHHSEEPFEVRHPILLADDPLTRLIIKDVHENRVMHLRTEPVMTCLREEYWIVGARRLVKSVIHKCAKCLRDRAKLVDADEAPLPASRTELSFRPFKTTGIDYMGPLLVRSNGVERKVWVALFTCAAIRAVHLEVVEDLSTASCLSAIRRFIARYGRPDCMMSDNALQFKKAHRCLAALWQSLRSEPVQNFFGKEGIQWKFNVPRAPWWGGFFERLIGVVKRCLRKAVGTQKLNLLEFTTVLHEVAAVVNQRPLTGQPCEVGNPRALTPSSFLGPAIPLSLPAGQIIGLGEKPDGLVKLWRTRERILQTFWRRWREEYLLYLRTAVRRQGDGGAALCVGDIVIIKEDSTARTFWKLGRIEEALPSRDGVPRAYKVHLGNGVFVDRPGKLLAKLL